MTAGTPAPAEGDSAKPSHWLEGGRLRVYPWIILGPFLIGTAIWTALWFPSMLDPFGRPLGSDVLQFWSAARLAIEGRPEAAYDWRAFLGIEQQVVPALREVFSPWHYPPTYLLVVLPLGLLPYLPALGVYLAATWALWAALIRCMFADRRAWAVAAALPAGLLNVSCGQTGFLTAGLAGFALLALESRPVLAGVLIGLLAIKPHLALLFPVALIAARSWRAFAAAAATTLAFTTISIVAFDWANFAAFLDALPDLWQLMHASGLVWWMMPNGYVFALSLGLSVGAASALQVAAAAVAAISVWTAWRRPSVPYEAKAATLLIAAMLVSPYLYYYDLTWAGVGMAWLVRLGLRTGFLRGESELLLAAGIVPLFAYWVYEVTRVQIGFPMLLALLALAMARCGVLPWPGSAGKFAR